MYVLGTNLKSPPTHKTCKGRPEREAGHAEILYSGKSCPLCYEINQNIMLIGDLKHQTERIEGMKEQLEYERGRLEAFQKTYVKPITKICATCTRVAPIHVAPCDCCKCHPIPFRKDWPNISDLVDLKENPSPQSSPHGGEEARKENIMNTNLGLMSHPVRITPNCTKNHGIENRVDYAFSLIREHLIKSLEKFPDKEITVGYCIKFEE